MSSSNRNDWSRDVGIQGHRKMGVDVGMGFMGGDKGGLVMIVVIVGGPRPLLRALWGRLSNKVEAALLGTVHRCHQQVPCSEAGQGPGGRGQGWGSRPTNFRSGNGQDGP